MDDMQSRIAARRAEIERQRRGEPTGSNADYDDIFDGLFGGGKAGKPDGLPANSAAGRPGAAAEHANDASVQERIAARRGELNRERAGAEAAAKAAEAARKAAAERERADRERARLADAAPTTKEAADQLLNETIRRRWPASEWAVVGLTGALGLWLLSSHPFWGIVAILLAAGMYVGRNATHREELQKEYPDLFGPRSD